MLYTQCTILENTQIADNYFLIKFFSKQLTQNARAGQFVELKTADGAEPLLMRPFSFFEINREKNTFSVLYEVKGKGTKLLSRINKDEKINVLGPLGNWFKYPKYAKKILLIAGGVGIAPLASFSDDLIRCKKEVTLLLGLRERSIFNFLRNHLKIESKNFLVSVEDGRGGWKGTVVNFFETIASKQSYDRIFACGPNLMLKELQRVFAENKTPVWCCLEARMACGIGACLGCAVTVKKRDKPVYKRVCSDGPIFNLKEIIF